MACCSFLIINKILEQSDTFIKVGLEPRRGPDLSLCCVKFVGLDPIQEVTNFRDRLSMPAYPCSTNPSRILMHANVLFIVPTAPITMIRQILKLDFGFVCLVIHVVRSKIVGLQHHVSQTTILIALGRAYICPTLMGACQVRDLLPDFDIISEIFIHIITMWACPMSSSTLLGHIAGAVGSGMMVTQSQTM